MVPPVPTKCEFVCAGLSLILAQILSMAVGLLWSREYEYYNVNNEQDVIKLHELMSSDSYRTRAEIAVTLQWLILPLSLCALYGMTKFNKAAFQNTPGIPQLSLQFVCT